MKMTIEIPDEVAERYQDVKEFLKIELSSVFHGTTKDDILISIHEEMESVQVIMKAEKTSDYIKQLIQIVNEGGHVFHGRTYKSSVVGCFKDILYRVEKLEEMASKQEAMKVGKKWNGNDYDAFCPKCGNGVWEMNYCQECGQKLDWSDND